MAPARGKKSRRNESTAAKAPRYGPPPVAPVTMEPVAEEDGGEPMTTILKSSWKKMQDKATLCVQKDRELLEEKKKLENAQKHNEQLSNALASSTRLRQKLEDEIQEKDMEIEDLLEKVEEMTKALRKGGKVADCELNEQLKERVTAAAKEYLFRIVKFVEDDDDLKTLTEQIIEYLPNKEKDIHPLSVEKFQDLYYLCVNDGIKSGRQYLCNEGKKRVQGKLT